MADAPTRIHEPSQRAPAREPLALPPVDVRRKRPPALSFLLRMETLRHAARVSSLLALDFVGLFGALWTALMVKAVVRYDVWAWHSTFTEARHTVACA